MKVAETIVAPVGARAGVRGAGPSERELVRRSGRYALWLRTATVLLCGAFGLVASGPHVAPAVVCASVWSLAEVGWRLGRSPKSWFVAVDGLVVFAVGLSQVHLGPQPVSSWVFAVASMTAVTCHYEWLHRPVGGWVIAGLSLGGYLAGSLLAGPDGGLTGRLLTLGVQSLLAWVGLRVVLNSARAADRIAHRTTVRRQQATVARARRAAEREYLAVLHDTASTTLLMVASGASDDLSWLPGRARQDLDALAALPGTVARELDLSALLRSLAGFPDVRIELDVRGPLVIPATPALAIFLGAREALNNIRQHAGDTGAMLHARRDAAGRVVIELKDHGRGFRPVDVPEHRRGISGSIAGRMRAAGGHAEVTSGVGAGTTVRWRWPHAG